MFEQILESMRPEDIKILIVDDEPDILEFLEYNLKLESFTVLKAKNGEQALAINNDDKPDIILLDIMMPKMDGVEVCRQIRSNPKFSDTIIAFLTARGEDFTQIAALEAGGDDFITKPIRPRVLISRIKALIRRLDRPDGTLKSGHVGDLFINKERYTVERGEEVIELPKKEFDLLSLLASKPGKVFTREEIFNKVWGTQVIVGPRTIDVHIRKLREKLGKRYIKTVKGIGYKFEF